MAPAMVSAWMGAMNSVLAKLVILLGDEYKLLTKGIRKKVVFLKDELVTMRALLEKLAAVEDHDPLIMGWMRQVREMTYDLEDSIDEFLHMDTAHQGMFHRKLKRLKARLQLSEKIQILEQRIHEASLRRSRYKIDDAATFTCPAVPIDPRLSAPGPGKGNPVGIDRPVEELKGLLTDGHQKLKVVAIVGFGGLGKTTLAMNVYERLRLQFDCGAVVTVSQCLDASRLLRCVLSQVYAGNNNSSRAFDDVRSLIDALREIFCRKRYFIVIDDIWDISAWHLISLAFPENNRGSRILVTTRIEQVAHSCCRDNGQSIYYMQPLDIINSRALFFRRIFHFESEESCPPELIDIAYAILAKCNGLPLVIIAMAGLLATREGAREAWKYISDNMSRPLYNNITYENIVHILNLCYNDLPLHLKTCLSYLTMFQEHHIIDRKRVVRRWIAEGFVSTEHGLELEEVGEYYFNELINRGLIQAVDIQYDGRVGACQVHDIVLEVICRKSIQENFVTRCEDGNMFGPQDKVRRLYLDCQNLGDIFRPSEITAFHVRSLTIVGSSMPSLENFRALRVLDMEHYGDLDRPYLKNIGRLYLLKFLRLEASFIQLPEEIGELRYLETLDVSGAVGCELPKSIVRLKTLMYLLVNNVKLPDGLGSMQSLRELSCVKIDSSNSLKSLEELGNLSLLSTMRINWCIDNRDMETYVGVFVSSLRKLSTLKLQCFCIETASCSSLDFLSDCFSIPCYRLQEFQMASDYYLPSVPEWMDSLVNLTLLRINIEVVGDDVLQILGGLKALRALILVVKSIASGKSLVIRSSGFERLKQFDLICWNGWAMLMFEPGAMIILEKLRVAFSAQGEYVATGVQISIEHLTALKHVVAEIYSKNKQDVKAAVHAIKNVVSKHPNHPRLELQGLCEGLIVEDEMDIIVHDEEMKDQNEGENDVDYEIMVEKQSLKDK